MNTNTTTPINLSPPLAGPQKERPILFSAEMVRAILDGKKTQTRRIIKPQPLPETDAVRDIPETPRWYAAWAEDDKWGTTYRPLGSDQQHEWKCPYGVPGDRLWVRERIAVRASDGSIECVEYWSDGAAYHVLREDSGRGDIVGVDWESRPVCTMPTKWRPSIHMPRWASRITLEVTNVRVERVQDISESDAIAEGCATGLRYTARDRFSLLWERINGTRSWDANPWVWVVEFKQVPRP